MKIEIDIINLTPHPVEYMTSEGKTIQFPSKGVARLKSHEYKEIFLGPIKMISYEESNPQVDGLPSEKNGVLYIVSTVVKTALWGKRSDLISPCMIDKDAQGNVLHCNAFKI